MVLLYSYFFFSFFPYWHAIFIARAHTHLVCGTASAEVKCVCLSVCLPVCLCLSVSVCVCLFLATSVPASAACGSLRRYFCRPTLSPVHGLFFLFFFFFSSFCFFSSLSSPPLPSPFFLFPFARMLFQCHKRPTGPVALL